ncbi:MAG: helix-hairpin-helix domain-containing protein [Verrucomicrobiales bacterium]|nr:helix-hairpin-helix domain-containing protein [Verrucomicrobiota bacterium JB025]
MRLLTAIVILLQATLLAAPLQEIPHCTLIETEWADGDSFSVRLPDGKAQTVRLYGVDCIEMHVTGDDSNARRLRDQRRYFGIDDITLAKSIGVTAKTATFRLLSQPFTLHTGFSDARGDGRYSRVYAFITLNDGRDLSETLVSAGLARAFGVTRQLPDGTSAADWKEALKDLELTAAHNSLGAWKHTDWRKLPLLRKEVRHEQNELEIAKGTQPVGENDPIDINTAPRDTLISLPGIGEKTANEIISHRPYPSIDSLDEVPGIGPKTIDRIRPFISVGKP